MPIAVLPSHQSPLAHIKIGAWLQGAGIEAQAKQLAEVQAARAAKPKMAHLILSSNPNGAMVHRGDSLLCTTPCDMDVPAGPPNETIKLMLAGFDEYPLKVSLVHGATVALALNLEKTASRSKPRRGSSKSKSKSKPSPAAATPAPAAAPASAKPAAPAKPRLPALPGFRKSKAPQKKSRPALPGFRR